MYRFASAVFLSSLLLTSLGSGQESDTEEVSADSAEVLPSGLPVKLDLSRRALKNFLTDETALTPYQTEESISDFPGAFTIGSPQARFAVIWAPTSCRIVGVLDLEAPADGESPPYTILASGIAPTTSIPGSSGSPVYFGMRMSEGRPEFLYTHGSHAIAESIWLEDDGAILKQRFVLRKGASPLRLTFPSEWVPLIESSAGEWKDNILEIAGESIEEVTLLYRLDARETKEEVSE